MSVVTIVVCRNSGVKSSRETRSPERARHASSVPDRRLGQERTNDDQRNGRDEARHQRVAPRFVPAADLGKRRAIRDHQIVGAGHHQPAERAERLRVADDLFAPFAIGEEFGEPRDGGDELHADANERAQRQKSSW